MFCITVSELNSAPSWNSTPQRCSSSRSSVVARRAATSRPSTSILPPCGRLQPDDRAQQHRLAAAGAADDAEDLAAPHVEVEAVMHGLRAEAGYQAAHPDHDVVSRAASRSRMSDPQHREQDREGGVGDDHQEDRLDDRLRGQPSDALGAAATR